MIKVKAFAGLFLITLGAAAYANQAQDQIQLDTYIVEVSTNDDLFGAAHWTNTVRHNDATFALKGDVGVPSDEIFPAGGFFNSGLILSAPTVRAAIRALAQRGDLKPAQPQVAYIKNGERAQILSVQRSQTIFLETVGTTPYTFHTGLALDVVPRTSGAEDIDLTIIPAFSAKTGTTQRDINVPIISSRSATARIRVRSGEAAVIGGITRYEDNSARKGIPGLQNIPFLQYLFQGPQAASGRTNLVIIVWPRIVDRAG
jgi:general secretion pathway protein D